MRVCSTISQMAQPQISYSLRPKSVNFDKVWGDLRPSVVDIINLHPITKRDWDHKFSDVYDICVAIPDPLSDKLYRSLVACVEEHVRTLHTRISQVSPGQLLQEYETMWKVYYKGAMFVHNLFGYLNKQFVKTKRNLDPDVAAQYAPYLQRSDVKEVGCMALDIWKNNLIRPVLQQLVDLLLAAIADDRAGRPPANRAVIQGVIMSLVQVEQYDFVGDPVRAEEMNAKYETLKEFYQNEFEVPFLRATEQYYSLLAQQLLAELSCSRYMETVIGVIDEEKIRAGCYLHKSSVDKVIKMCQTVMISAHLEKLNSVCSDLIKNEERRDLNNMYKLLKPIPGGLTAMIKEFEEYVKHKGHDAIAALSGENVPQQFVENILQVYDKFSEMKSTVFLDDGDFAGALDKALQNVVNARTDKTTSGSAGASKASERLARYADGLLRKSPRGLSESAIEERLTRAIVIFRYIEDKDVFQKFYSKMLSARLINNMSMSMECEEMMINKLKQACGYEFTCKLSRMFTDIGLCNELSQEFLKYQTDNNINCVSVQPVVLTAGSWPLSAPTLGGSGTPASHIESVNFVMPYELSLCTSEFQKFYLTKHSGRKLSWLSHASHGELRINYADKPYVVQGSVFQMAALICFNDTDHMTIADLTTATGLTGDLMPKLVRTLIDGGILKAKDKDLVDSSQISINLAMTQKRCRFKLPSVQSTKQVEKEVETVNNTISQDRKYYIECAVVRIMKTRKVLKHTQLVAEVMEQIKGRFKPDVSLVKKCIEDLIDKLYLQRTDQHDEYQYLA